MIPEIFYKYYMNVLVINHFTRCGLVFKRVKIVSPKKELAQANQLLVNCFGFDTEKD